MTAPKCIIYLLTLLCLSGTLAAQSNAVPSLDFRAAGNGEYHFDTGVLRGTLRLGGKSDGLMAVTHIPSGKRLDRSKGLFGHYRVFTTNKRYGGGAWDWPSEAKLLNDGSVETHWPAASDRPFEMWASYRWNSPDTLDLVTKVKALEPLPDFESFLASYFENSFSNSLVWAKTDGKTSFLPATLNHGVWQMFPRDSQGVKLIRDGRWTIPPSPVDWSIRPCFAAPLAIRRDPRSGLTAIVMAPASDSYAVAAPHQDENHRSIYLAQFGKTLKAGSMTAVRARLVITTETNEAAVISRYEKYLSEIPKLGK